MKKILAATLAFAMLFTVAFASVGFKDAEVTYKDGENVFVTVVSTADQDVLGGSYVNLGFDDSVWELVGIVFNEKFGTNGEHYFDATYETITPSPATDYSLTNGEPIFTVEFKAIAAVPADAKFELVDDQDSWCDQGCNTIPYGGTLAVKAGKVVVETEATYEANEVTLISPATGKETTYTNVPVFTASASGNFSLKATYDGGERAIAGGATFDVSNFNVGENGLDFQVAIVGVPTDITGLKLFVVE